MEEDEEAGQEGGADVHFQELLLDQLQEANSAAGLALDRRSSSPLYEVHMITL